MRSLRIRSDVTHGHIHLQFVELLLNHNESGAHWVGLRLRSETTKRDMLGARVEVLRQSQPPLVRIVASDGGYGSARDARVLVGLGEDAKMIEVCVTWPDGVKEVFTNIKVDAYQTLTQGKGKKKP